MTLRSIVRTLSCAGLLSLAGCNVAPADRINAALPPAPHVTAAQKAMFDAARAQKMDAVALDAQLRDRMERRALDCAAGYTPGVFDGNDQIRAKLTDVACFAKADAQLFEWLEERRGAMLGEPRVAPREVQPVQAAPAPRVVVETERMPPAQIAAPMGEIGVNAVPSDPRPEVATPTVDINHTRRELIERTIRENDVSPEMAAAMRKWADDVDRKSPVSTAAPTPTPAPAPIAASPGDEAPAGQIDIPSP
ncbi:hypothetical protein [Noviluteimonas gilva]|uniref:Lipoprotein n=1 Tax=Noviluteimonas gilva TaxID=2682097 RepID=A0A7C9M4D3_9GAMM|nr:hypothetical protein [Lysobacter gilvus]MUV14966.1 hypothetical protein [Lysobacter gilvus]